MKKKEEIKKQLSNLLKEQSNLIELASTLESKKIVNFGSRYQNWYTKAIKIVEALAPDRLDEFISYYRIDIKRKIMNGENFVIQDYIKGIGPAPNAVGKKPFEETQVVIIRIINQFQILNSLASRIDSVLADVTGHLLAELQDKELEAATKLTKISTRASGALAGVVLERHLQQLSKNHNVTVRKKAPTISDFNDLLKKAGVYDVPTWRKIQLLGDIRNLCSHQKSKEPTPDQVDELITGVNSIIKSLF